MLQTPRLAPPPPLRGSDPASFARHTVTARLPDLLRRTLDDNRDLPPAVRARLSGLLDAIPHGPIRPIGDLGAPDADAWSEYVAPYVDDDWLTAPWFFVETYFYRRIVAATGYFDGTCAGVDPFAAQKARGWASDRLAIDGLAQRVTDALDADRLTAEALAALLAAVLWGNRADLSMWPTDADGSSDGNAAADADAHRRADAHILADDRDACAAYLLDASPLDRVDVVLDNTGLELAGDLALAVLLLDGGLVRRVVLHAKAHPTFISDAIAEDVASTAERLAASDVPATRRFGERVRHHLGDALQVVSPFFWTSPLPGWDLPDALRDTLGASDLLVSKGDANYRRFLGDRHWTPTTPFDDVMAYVPTRFLALRTLKSEVIAGLAPDVVERVRRDDPEWRVSGEWAVAQFV